MRSLPHRSRRRRRSGLDITLRLRLRQLYAFHVLAHSMFHIPIRTYTYMDVPFPSAT
jgi:hypothetical protein